MGGGANKKPLTSIFKPIVASSLAISLGMSVASGACTATDPYACFTYSDTSLKTSFPLKQGDWEAFQSNSGSFESLTDTTNQITFTTKEGISATGFLGQVVGVSSPSGTGSSNVKKYLGIALGKDSGSTGAKLILDNIQGAWKDLHVGIYVDANGIPSTTTTSSGDLADDSTLLQISSDSSVMIGNIRVTNSGNIQTNPVQKNVAVLSFSGNHAVEASDFTKFEDANKQSGERPLSAILSKRDANYALIGGIANSSGTKVIATFNGGAKMFGDLYAASSGGSKIKVTFDGDSGNGASQTQARYVFEGGMLSVHGDNEVIVKKGDVFLDSVTFGNYGMLGQNNGYNQLTFGDATPDAKNNSTVTISQAGTASNVTALTIKAVTDANTQGKTGNFIYFTNAQTNTMNVRGTIGADRGANVIQTLGKATNNTKLNLIVSDAITTQATKYKDNRELIYGINNNYNKVIIDGNLTVGIEKLKSVSFNEDKTATPQPTVGIVSYSGQNNAVILGDTQNAKALDFGNSTGISAVTAGSTYDQNRSLTTARIVASGDNVKNTVQIDGDLTLVSKQTNTTTRYPERKGFFGGDITATSGGSNEIVIAGIIKGETTDSSSPTIDGDNMLILADGSGGINSITINNKNSSGQEIKLGKIFSSGSVNKLAITKNTTTTIHSVIATDKKFSSQDQDIGGTNELFFKDGSITINEIITRSNGTNTIAITRASSGSMTGTLKFAEYGIGGENKIYFGKNSGSVLKVADKFVEGVEVSLSNASKSQQLELGYTLNGSKLDLTIGNANGDRSYFNGRIAYANGTTNNTSNKNVNFKVENNSVFFAELALSNDTTSNLTLNDGAKFVLKNGSDTAIGTLTLQNSTTADSDYDKATESMSGTVVDIATGGIADVSKVADQRAGTARTLQVTSLAVNGGGTNAPLFRLYTDGVGKSDNVAISNKVSANTKVEAQVFLSADMINHNFGADSTKTIIFTNKGGTDSALDLGGKTKLATTGFTSYSLTITKENDGSNTIWRLGSVQDKQVNTEAVEYTTSAMGINYGIFVQNINSLNKRMGELRNNDDTQGVWARVFAGGSTNTMDLIPSTSTYVTVQGGYDYGFDVGSGKNYVGVALSYGYTSSETDRSTNSIASIVGYSAKSNNIELGIYNSYIQDEGWFSDTIAKFSYIMSDFDIYEQNSTQTQSLNNFALSLGQEVGYRFALGSEKNWFIDPQIELVAGYINSTDLSQTQAGQTLDGKLDSVFLFRTRVGSDFGYSLKKDKNQYDFRLGLSYEYDVANADAFFDIASANMSKVFSNAVDNDGRVVLNLGTNMKFGENMRLYFDFEKSFAGKITTDYQVNLGFRYGFGEKLVKVVEEVKTQEKAPLKIEDTQTQEQPQTQTQDKAL